MPPGAFQEAHQLKTGCLGGCRSETEHQTYEHGRGAEPGCHFCPHFFVNTAFCLAQLTIADLRTSVEENVTCPGCLKALTLPHDPEALRTSRDPSR